MLRRKMEQMLVDWKNTPDKKTLMIKGCRQCGSAGRQWFQPGLIVW